MDILKKICIALEWQGGTIHQAITEIKRLVWIRKKAIAFADIECSSYLPIMEVRDLALKSLVVALEEDLEVPDRFVKRE